MCHTEVPRGQSTPDVPRRESALALADGDELPFLVAGSDGGPVVVVIADVYGRSPFYEHLAGLVAQAGYTAVLPDLFFRQGALAEPSKEAAFARRRRLDEARSLTDLSELLDSLAGGADAAPVGTLGFCLGGTFALDLASTRANLVSVAYYGFPVPQAGLAMPPPAPMALVDELAGPVVAFWGSRDDVVGMDHVDEYIRRAAESPADFDAEIVPDVGHGFLAQADLRSPADPAGETWTRTLAHFATHLSPRAS